MATQMQPDPLLTAGELATQPAVRELARRLLVHGASPALARRILARVESLARRREGAHPLDLAAEAIGVAFPRVVLPAGAAGPSVLALLGAPGVGKSAVARKLALRLSAAGRRVAVLAVRQPGSSKPEWLVTWMHEIGVPAWIGDAAAPAPARALRSNVVLLVDGSGDLQRDTDCLEALAARSAPERLDLTRLAVLAADAAPERARADLRALAAAEPACAVLTRLDLADAPAASLEITAEAGLPLAFACDGVRDERHLHRVDPDRAADLFLKGRIA